MNWRDLEKELVELKDVIYEEDEGKETRPRNIEVAIGLIPLLENNLYPRFPVPTVRTSFDGSIEFVWIKDESLITCCIQAEIKGQEIDITKSMPNQKLVYRLLPYTPYNSIHVIYIVCVLQCYLGDVY